MNCTINKFAENVTKFCIEICTCAVTIFIHPVHELCIDYACDVPIFFLLIKSFMHAQGTIQILYPRYTRNMPENG